MLRSDVIQKWWPTTQSLDLVEGSVEDVAAALETEVTRFLPDEPIKTSWESFRRLEDAFQAAPDFSNVPTVYLVLPTRSKWSVLWNNSFLCDGYDSLCWCLTQNHGLTTVHWSSHDAWTSFQSGSHFTHRRLEGGTLIERSVQAAQSDKRWLFVQSGDPLPEEDLESYTAHRKRDRLNEQKMAALMTRLGASPWQEAFYAMETFSTFVLARPKAPPTVLRRARAEVLLP